MPVEINVGPPVLTINQGSTFMVSDLNGEMKTETELGVFAADTRYVSDFEISANGYPWLLLTSSATTYYSARIYLTNPDLITEQGPVPEGALALLISRSVGDGVHEDLDLTNHGLEPVRFNLEIALRSDFADIFEVKSHNFVRRGRIVTNWDGKRQELRTSYTHRDFRRNFTYRVLNNGSRPVYANGRITFEVELAPGASWHSCGFYVLGHGARVREPLRACHDSAETELDELQREWEDCATKLTSANEEVYRLYRRSVEDIGALRLHEHDFAHDVWLPAAGVPWFVTIFGRDSLIVSM